MYWSTISDSESSFWWCFLSDKSTMILSPRLPAVTRFFHFFYLFLAKKGSSRFQNYPVQIFTRSFSLLILCPPLRQKLGLGNVLVYYLWFGIEFLMAFSIRRKHHDFVTVVACRNSFFSLFYLFWRRKVVPDSRITESLLCFVQIFYVFSCIVENRPLYQEMAWSDESMSRRGSRERNGRVLGTTMSSAAIVSAWLTITTLCCCCQCCHCVVIVFAVAVLIVFVVVWHHRCRHHRRRSALSTESMK